MIINISLILFLLLSLIDMGIFQIELNTTKGHFIMMNNGIYKLHRHGYKFQLS